MKLDTIFFFAVFTLSACGLIYSMNITAKPVPLEKSRLLEMPSMNTQAKALHKEVHALKFMVRSKKQKRIEALDPIIIDCSK
jgi:hypothetical protein